MTRTKFEVMLTQGAEDDLEQIHGWLADQRSSDDADALLDDFIRVIAGLEDFPLRGTVPKELDALGLREFRQVLLRQYRVIYRVVGTAVLVLIVADGRRDMQALLERRLLGR